MTNHDNPCPEDTTGEHDFEPDTEPWDDGDSLIEQVQCAHCGLQCLREIPAPQASRPVQGTTLPDSGR